MAVRPPTRTFAVIITVVSALAVSACSNHEPAHIDLGQPRPTEAPEATLPEHTRPTSAPLTGDGSGPEIMLDGARRQSATAQLRSVQQASAFHLASNGSLAGFADSYRNSDPATVANLDLLTDDGATVVLGEHQCLVVRFPEGPISEGNC